jgi:hypothetical protein
LRNSSPLLLSDGQCWPRVRGVSNLLIDAPVACGVCIRQGDARDATPDSSQRQNKFSIGVLSHKKSAGH